MMDISVFEEHSGNILGLWFFIVFIELSSKTGKSFLFYFSCREGFAKAVASGISCYTSL